jgi:Flp pilus assembly protein CpaB
MNNNQKTIIAMIAIFAAIGLVAAVAVPTVVVPQQAFADPAPGNSFKNCHSFGPGHSNDACR